MEIPTNPTDNNILSQWRLKVQNEGISAKLFVMRASSQSRLEWSRATERQVAVVVEIWSRAGQCGGVLFS
jgi:hypothetical protein